MSLPVEEIIYLAIQCPNCGQRTQKLLAWLASKDNMVCSGCGSVIDLKSAGNKLLINEFTKHCSRVDAVLKSASVKWKHSHSS